MPFEGSILRRCQFERAGAFPRCTPVCRERTRHQQRNFMSGKAQQPRRLLLRAAKEHDIVADATLQPVWVVTRLFPSHETYEFPPVVRGSG
jgi:hypothetical protein